MYGPLAGLLIWHEKAILRRPACWQMPLLKLPTFRICTNC